MAVSPTGPRGAAPADEARRLLEERIEQARQRRADLERLAEERREREAAAARRADEAGRGARVDRYA
jgi:hypothetical protein